MLRVMLEPKRWTVVVGAVLSACTPSTMDRISDNSILLADAQAAHDATASDSATFAGLRLRRRLGRQLRRRLRLGCWAGYLSSTRTRHADASLRTLQLRLERVGDHA